MGRLESCAYRGISRLKIMDTMFFIGMNIALLGYLVNGLPTAREKTSLAAKRSTDVTAK